MIDLFVKQVSSSICLGYEKKIYNRKISRNMFRNSDCFWNRDFYTFSDMWKIWRKETKWQQ